MIYERDVRAKIAAVLANEISIGDFARWIMSNSWNMHKDSSPDAVALVSDVHLLLAERDDFSRDDDGFRNGLSSLANNIIVSSPVDVVGASVQAKCGFFTVHPSQQQLVLLKAVAA